MSADTFTAVAGISQPGRVSIWLDEGSEAPSTHLATIPWAEAEQLANQLREAARRARIYKAGLSPDERYTKRRGRVVWRVHDVTSAGAHLLRVDGDQSAYESPANLEEVRA